MNDEVDVHVALTGASGFLGRHILKTLLANGLSPVVICGDVRYGLQADGSVDVVCHLAGRVGESFARDPHEAARINMVGTLNVLELCRKTGARLVFASSCSVYRPDRGTIKETAPMGPVGSYGFSKCMAEELCRAYSQYAGVRTVIIRLFNSYGRGQPGGFLVPYLCTAIRAGEPLKLRHPTSIRDFVHVQDVAEAFHRACLWKGPSRVVNIGSGVPVRVVEVAEMISRISEQAYEWEHIPSDEDPYGEMWADISVAKSEFDWAPRISLEAGLRMQLRDDGSGNPA